jgi:hypothetical protein
MLVRMWGKRKLHTLLLGMQAGVTTLEKKIWALVKYLNIDLPYHPAIPLLDIYLKECDSGYSKGTCTFLFIAVLFSMANLRIQPRSPTTEELIKKMWYLHIVEF